MTTVPAPKPIASGRVHWGWVALVVLGGVIAVGALAFPTYANYDSTYSLLWGRELLHGHSPSFEAYRAPTEHPLGIAFGLLLAPLGQGADRLMVLATMLSFVVLVAGLYRLGRVSFTPLVGLLAAVILCTRFDFPFLAARAYIDIPYLALVIWAAALEAARPRRGLAVLVLLGLAGLLRPEAWLLSGVYWLWLLPVLSWRARSLTALLVGAAPLIWIALDYAVTGDPLFSQNHTSGLAEELGRQKGLGEVPGAAVSFLKSLVKFPVAVAGAVGLVITVLLTPRRAAVPLALLVIGLATFVLVGAAGLSVINRYLLVPSLMVMLLAAVAVCGWTMLEPGRLRRAWWASAVAGMLFAVVWTALRVNLGGLTNELRFRGDSHASLVSLLDRPAVRRALRCGPVTTPNHKLIPDVRWILDLPERRVIARSDPASDGRAAGGVAILAANRTVLLRQGFNPDDVSPKDTGFNMPPPSYQRIAVSAYYSAYARCPA